LNRIAEHIRRHTADGIDVQVLPWQIDSVVSLRACYPCPVDLGAGEGFVLDLVAAMLDKGTRSRSKASINDELEGIGASISFSSSGNRLDVSARCLIRDLDTVLDLIREQIVEPSFNERELSLVKGRTRAHLTRQKSDPAFMSRSRLSRSLFGPDHPSYELALDDLLERVEQIDSAGLRAFHGRSTLWDGLRAAMVGDVGGLNPARLAERLAVRADGEGKGFEDVSTPGLQPAVPGTHHIEIPERPNLNVLMAHPVDVTTISDDYLPLWIGTFVLGGNFSSRLMSEVRDEKGLTYGIRSYLSGMGAHRAGAWMTSVTLSADKLEEGLTATRSVLDRFVRDGVSDEELQERKETMIGSYEVDLSTTSGVASRLLLNMNRGWEPERIDEHPTMVDDIQTDEVNDVVQQLLDPSQLTVVTAGSRG